MALSEEQKTLAKQKAKAYLEQSIYNLAIMLGLDPSDLPSPYTNPLDESLISSPMWVSHESLKSQIEAYSKID